MVLYTVLTELIFRTARIFAPSKSWLATVTSENDWKHKKPHKGKVVWMHCASLGEFEMGKPILEGFLNRNPHWSGVVTFFSPSGYEPRKNYERATVHYFAGRCALRSFKMVKVLQPDIGSICAL